MQINSVSFVNLADSREAVAMTASDDTELKSKESSLSAVNEASETEDSGRQSEQKPSQENSSASDLTEQELQQIRKLEARDREVRAHEQAHQSVGGQYTGSASFTYQRGPDGVSYAIGGEVPIDTGKVEGDPQATIEKADVVRRAALAPAEPSAQDRLVASNASQIKLEAQADLAEMRAEAAKEDTEDSRAATEESDETTRSEDEQTTPGSTQAASSRDESSSDSEEENADSVNSFDDGSLSPEDFSHLLASEIARRNAMAVFENINRDPPKGNLDELV
ncbi:putative metalloprotease CJM1_0395 family protein [Litoribrevibacter albus]|uniref:Catalase n=1 Tax=Litoribrevibacter albus TaxID=1473156 RepID=A0AA37SD51_9GAMM|nr:putative metalloprotease CJM1_0395 family protein [Litoribrevibacter albus]GLQ33279.1 hypothetical protein GCM10007876_37590 [Litoribrevibacter albus]